MHIYLLPQYFYRSAVLHQPAWRSWFYHRAPRCTLPSAQLHSSLEADDLVKPGTHPIVATGEKRGGVTDDTRWRWEESNDPWRTCMTYMWQCHNKAVDILYLWENVRSDHASPPLAGHPICWSQRQWPFPDICWDWVDYSSLHRTRVAAREGLIEAHDRWAGSRHYLVVSILVGHRRLGGRQDGVGQVRSTRGRVRLLPAQLPSIIHRMLPVKQESFKMNFYKYFLNTVLWKCWRYENGILIIRGSWGIEKPSKSNPKCPPITHWPQLSSSSESGHKDRDVQGGKNPHVLNVSLTGIMANANVELTFQDKWKHE